MIRKRGNQETQAIDRFIGNKVYMLRLTKGMTRQQLGCIIGVTHQQLQKYEKGTNRITASRLVLVAKALNKPIDYFYDDTNNDMEMNTSRQSQRMCLEISRNFMKINNLEHQEAVNRLIKSLANKNANNKAHVA